MPLPEVLARKAIRFLDWIGGLLGFGVWPQVHRVQMMTRHDCHLCMDAWQLLQEQQRRHGFELIATDVDADPDLARLYGERVPVVLVDERERFWGKVNPVLVRRFFAATKRASRPGTGA